MASEFSQAELDNVLAENTVKRLRADFESKGKRVSGHDVRSEYNKYLEEHCISLRAAMLKNLFKNFQYMETMASELEVKF